MGGARHLTVVVAINPLFFANGELSDRVSAERNESGDVIGINNPAGNQRKEQRKGLRQNIRLFFVLKDLDHTTLFARARFYPAPVSSARRVRRFARHR